MLSRMFDNRPVHRGGGRVAQAGLAAIALLSLAFAPALADGSITTNCVRGPAFSSCVTVWRSGLGGSAAQRLWTPEAERETTEAAKRERLWVARCRPTLHYDDYGVGRYRYAAPGCEFGRYQ